MKIVDVFNHEWDVDCIGCALSEKRVIPPGGIICETESFLLHQDPEIPIKGFLIIATKSHVKSITQLTKKQMDELSNLLYAARMALLAVTDVLECTIIQEERSGHFHMCILPRYDWMNDQFENSLSSIRPMAKHAKDVMKTQKNIDEIIDVVKKIQCGIRDYL